MAKATPPCLLATLRATWTTGLFENSLARMETLWKPRQGSLPGLLSKFLRPNVKTACAGSQHGPGPFVGDCTAH